MGALNTLLRSRSIRWRMNALLAVVLALFGVVAVVAFVVGQRIKSMNEDFVDHAVAEIRSVAATRVAIGQVRVLEKSMVIEYEDTQRVAAHRQAWNAATARVQKALEALLVGEEDQDNAHARKGLEELKNYIQRSNGVLDRVSAGDYDNPRTADRMLGRAKEHMALLEAELDTIDGIVNAETTSSQAALANMVHQTGLGLVVAIAVVMLAVVPLTLVSARSIITPVQQARQVALAIAEGDLRQPVVATGHDEASELLRALAHMQQALAGVVGEVRAASVQVKQGAGEMQSGSGELGQRTEQASGQLQRTASSMTQLTGTVQQTADSAAQANTLATRAAEVAARGGELVQQVVGTMQEIHASSRRIADIIGTIDGIAFQTNILALNAAVEAARAGEQGRGFAVVAGEVRSLAGRSAEAAREIKSLINSSVQGVDSGSQIVNQAGQTMQEIVASVQRVADIIGEISLAANEQSSGIAQVGTAVAELDGMTEQNAALVQQSTRAATSLREQSERLAALTQRFRLAAGAPSLDNA
jgi:methyl-accepting chemotaxis protein